MDAVTKPEKRTLTQTQTTTTTTYLRRQIVHHRVVDGGQLDKVLGHQVHVVAERARMRRLGEAPQKVDGQRAAHVELERFEDVPLHVEDLLLVVRVVGDVHKVTDLRRIQLLVFRCHEQCGHADQLQILARRRFHHLQIAIDDGDGHEERLLHERELHVHLVQPVDQNAAHLVRHLALVVQIVAVYRVALLQRVHILVDVVDVLGHQNQVAAVGGINVLDLRTCAHTVD